MISETSKELLKAVLSSSFPDQTVRCNDTHGGGASSIAVTTPQINSSQLSDLASVVKVTGAVVQIKRSGTGVSIILN